MKKLLDVVTALSGSGPAYYFLMIEAMKNAAVKLGLPEDAAKQLTLQTALGSARLALESEQNIETLRKQVTSKGGTTEQALAALEKGQFRQVIFNAVLAAQQRAIELNELLINKEDE